MEKIILTPRILSQNGVVALYTVTFMTEDGPHLGDFRLDVDGYYYFIHPDGGGYWSSHTLRWIADKLDEINKPWDDKIKEYFEKERERNQNGDRQE